MLHHDIGPTHTSLLVRKFLAKRETTAIPQPPPLPRFGPSRLLFVLEVEIHSESLPISSGRGDGREFATGPTGCPAKSVPVLGENVASGGKTMESDTLKKTSFMK
jgi:hypothetical protein